MSTPSSSHLWDLGPRQYLFYRQHGVNPLSPLSTVAVHISVPSTAAESATTAIVTPLNPSLVLNAFAASIFMIQCGHGCSKLIRLLVMIVYRSVSVCCCCCCCCSLGLIQLKIPRKLEQRYRYSRTQAPGCDGMAAVVHGGVVQHQGHDTSLT